MDCFPYKYSNAILASGGLCCRPGAGVKNSTGSEIFDGKGFEERKSMGSV